MNLQIERLIVWPMREGFVRNEVKFKLDCVNVLSGESRTGKSAVSSIIDYCLGSSECTIPIGRVRENVSWFGIVIVLDSGRYLLARRNPMENACTDESFIKQINDDADIPDCIGAGTDNATDVTTMLAQVAGIPDIPRGDYGFVSNRLGFRDTTHLLFQVQDIVANRYILFYKMQKPEIMEHFAAWFNFIIGAETVKDVVNRQTLEELGRQLRAIEFERDKMVRKVVSWNNKLRACLVEAKSYGFCFKDSEVPGSDDKMLFAEAKRLVKDRDHLVESVQRGDGVAAELKKLREDSGKILAEVRELEREVDGLKDLKESILYQESATRSLKDRLCIANWLKENAQPTVEACPVCGEAGHSESTHELEKIIAVVKDCENAIQAAEAFPAVTLSEIQEKEKRLAKVRKQFNDLDEQIKALVKIDEQEAKDFLARTNNASALLARLAMIVELNEQLTADGNEAKEKEIKARIKAIRAEFDEKIIKQREADRLAQIGELALARLQTLDSEEQYRINPPVFKKRDMNIVIKDARNKEHTLGEVGSASNWVALHIAVTCALQEFFVAMKDPPASVPNFMVYDQPSQVYFPSGKRDQKDPHSDSEETVEEDLPNETDKEAVRKIFETIANSIAETKKSQGRTWQAIVLEHAGPDIYGAIEGVNVIEPWRDGRALIPHEWYENEA